MKVVYGFLTFILGGVVLWSVVAWRDRELVKRIKSEMSITARDTAILGLDDRREIRDAGYVRSVGNYRDVRDRTLRANPTNQPARDVASAADVVVDSADALRAVNDTLRDSLVAQVKAVKDLKKKAPPRISAFVLGGYDWFNSTPIAQAGAEVRVGGPLSVTAYVEAARGDDAEKIRSRGVVAAKFTFR